MIEQPTLNAAKFVLFFKTDINEKFEKFDFVCYTNLES